MSDDLPLAMILAPAQDIIAPPVEEQLPEPPPPPAQEYQVQAVERVFTEENDEGRALASFLGVQAGMILLNDMRKDLFATDDEEDEEEAKKKKPRQKEEPKPKP